MQQYRAAFLNLWLTSLPCGVAAWGSCLVTYVSSEQKLRIIKLYGEYFRLRRGDSIQERRQRLSFVCPVLPVSQKTLGG